MPIDGTGTMPLLTGAGLRSAHEYTLNQIVQMVQDRVNSPSLTESTVVRYLNQGLQKIITELAPKRVYLPSLITTAEVETGTATDVCALPADWFGKLHGAWDVATGRQIKVMTWTALQRRRGPGPIRHGVLCGVAVYGGQLRYWMVPSAPRRIVLEYIRQPHPLVAPTDKPLDLPPEISLQVLVDYACGEAFSLLEQDQGDPRVQTNDYRGKFADTLAKLAVDIGPWPDEAAPITDEMGWGWM